MKAFAATLLLLLTGAVAASAARSQSDLSPVSRTVELLEGLAEKVEKDGKAEEDLYETFVCWAKSIISQKTASNAAATSRIEMLKQYISDLDNGRIELTSERTDLETQIEKLKGEIEIATENRKKEKSDFEDAEDEMNKAITALNRAITVLKEATAQHKSGVFMSLEDKLSEGYSMRAEQAASLKRAADLGEKVLTKSDAFFLRRLLTGEVPTADWKKLNRKATFKMDYKARSFKIQEVLAKLLQEISGNLEEATTTELEAVNTFEKLSKSKNGELTAAESALDELAGEKGAKAMSREESQTEVDALEEQVENDEGYIEQVKKELAEKKLEWKDRKALRAEEIAAISKAISILHNDDARDTFKKSFASHDMSFGFLQLGMSSQEHLRRSTTAVETLRAAARQGSDARLSVLAARLATGSHFDEVIHAIDSMIATLKSEEEDDLTKKETCEADRATDTRSAALAARAIDEMTDTISKLTKEIADLTKEIADKEQTIADAKDELAEAKKIRGEENAEYLQNKADDTLAGETVMNAKNVLENFYKDNNLVFAQTKAKAKQPFESTAGEAPPPPPTTWDAPYGGATGESTGIVAILQMIHEDIMKDIAKADKEEAASLALYEKTKKALDDDVISLNGEINDMNATISSKDQAIQSTKGEKQVKKGELDATMKKMADANDFCEFFTINYPLRLKNRQVEMDGLSKAKAILQGGAFSSTDPNREIKPGDAFIQKYSKKSLRVRTLA